MILISHPTGNQNSRQASLAALENNHLHALTTSLALESGRAPWSWLSTRLQKEIARRDFSECAGTQVRSLAPIREAARLIAPHIGWKRLNLHETGWGCIDAVYQSCDQSTASIVESEYKNLSCVHTYEDGALATLTAVKNNKLRGVYELPIGYWRAHKELCDEEAELQPAWAATWTANQDSSAKTERKDQELELADTIIVPGRFVKQTLSRYPKALSDVRVIPYGCPPPIRSDERTWYRGGTLKVLFVGGLSQRKGLSYLIEAVRPFGSQVTVTIIGNGPGASLIRAKLPEARLLGSIPHNQVLAQMRQHDVFLFPSLFEGFALVVTEALAQGLPIITTPNAGSSDLIIDDQAGVVVPIRSIDPIRDAIAGYLKNPAQLCSAGQEALKVAKAYSWASYRLNLYRAWKNDR